MASGEGVGERAGALFLAVRSAHSEGAGGAEDG